jgi:peptide chain release factor 3
MSRNVHSGKIMNQINQKMSNEILPTLNTHQAQLKNEIAKRRTFAIISHPDAGKTTLTEKLLLYSGMIRTAGMVRGRKSGKFAVSDWMGMEQERGISITASAMQFEYQNIIINVLDTPGHQDFSEDTYRTLTAADSAVMVIDAAKGVEAQTRKLFEVCHLRKIPVLTFINKMDLPSRDPLDLLSEVEQVLQIQSSPLNWPIGSGQQFKGVVDLISEQCMVFEKSVAGGAKPALIQNFSLQDEKLKKLLSFQELNQLQQEMRLLKEAGNPFRQDLFLRGEITPVFFGSALTNFGLEPFFDAFIHLAPPPGIRLARTLDGQEIQVHPVNNSFSAYVFKLQTNMNPHHCDSMAFLRICSGRFEKDLIVKHIRLNRQMRLSQPSSLIARERNSLLEAFPGDIIGVMNSGLFQIGDTVLTDAVFEFPPLPQFQPEVFAVVRPIEISKRKSFDKGLELLILEGTVQLLKRLDDLEIYVAAVGSLQFDVLKFRLKHEFGVEIDIQLLPFKCSAWLIGDPNSFQKPSQSLVVKDFKNRLIVLFSNPWEKDYAQSKNPHHQLLDMII